MTIEGSLISAHSIGRLVRLDARIPARVVGVFADYRDDTDLAYSVMASWPLVKERLNGRPEDQPFDNTNGSTHCFALFNDRFTFADWHRQLPSFVKKYNPAKVKETSYPAILFSSMHLSCDFHFYTLLLSGRRFNQLARFRHSLFEDKV